MPNRFYEPEKPTYREPTSEEMGDIEGMLLIMIGKTENIVREFAERNELAPERIMGLIDKRENIFRCTWCKDWHEGHYMEGGESICPDCHEEEEERQEKEEQKRIEEEEEEEAEEEARRDDEQEREARDFATRERERAEMFSPEE